MGYGTGDENSEREWMPSVDAFFGGEGGTSLHVMPFSDVDSQRSDEERTTQIQTHASGNESPGELDSAKDVSGFRQNSCSMKSGCLDPPPEEEQVGSELVEDASHAEHLTTQCNQLQLLNDFLKAQLKAKRDDVDSDHEEERLEHFSPSSCAKKRLKHGTFDSLRQAWESQRELLMERLKKKDEVISRQNLLLLENGKSLRQMAAGLDGLETRFSQEMESHRLQLGQLEVKSQGKIAAIDSSTTEIEKQQKHIKTDLEQLSASTKEEIQSLEAALQRRSVLYTQSEVEKQSVISKLDAVEEELTALKRENLKLVEHLSAEKAKALQLQEQLDTRHPVEQGLGQSLEWCLCKQDTLAADDVAREKANADVIQKENAQLNREVLELREELIDLTEHSEKLESQVQEQQRAFHQCCSQIRELEILKNTKEDFVAIIATKQEAIDSLKQSLGRLHFEMRQAPEAPASAGMRFLEEVLAAQLRCEEMETLFMNAQSERDGYKKEMSRLIEIVHSMDRDAKRKLRSHEKLRKEHTRLQRISSCQKSEITTLQTNLRVEALKTASNPRRRNRSDGEVDSDVMKELVKSKLALAEMSEVVDELRHELSSLKSTTTANNPITKTKTGYNHLIRKTFAGVLTR